MFGAAYLSFLHKDRERPKAAPDSLLSPPAVLFPGQSFP